jgi:hypothetical protein
MEKFWNWDIFVLLKISNNHTVVKRPEPLYSPHSSKNLAKAGILQLHVQQDIKCKIWGFLSGDCRLPSSGMLHHVALVRTDVSDELMGSIIRVTRVSKLGMLAVTRNQSMLQRNTMWALYFIVFLCNVLQLLVVADVPGSLILVTLMMEMIHSS